MAMARYDIFREQLASEYPEYGHALWEPNPRRADRPVQVGDVGFVLKGKFQRLFNALLPADDPSHDLGVPEYHEQLVPNLPDHIDNRFLNPQHYCSAGITVEIEPDLHAGPEDFPRVSFSYSGRRGGAVLSLPLTARREDTLAQRDFGKWIVKHIDRCFAFAQRYGLEIERMEDIVLVTGCDRARSWTNVAFSGGQAGAQVSFGIEVLNGADVPNTSVNFQFLPEHVRGAVVNQGPEGRDLPENQCVFIRGFRVARPLGFLPKQLKAAAEPTPDDYDREPDGELVLIPAITNYRDPLHLLVNYIAERASDCDMVLVHDDDLKRIDGLGGGTSSDVLQPDMMMNILRKSNLDIYKARFNGTSPSTDTDVVRVAMLSTTFQSWRRSASPEGDSPHLTVSPVTDMALKSAKFEGMFRAALKRYTEQTEKDLLSDQLAIEIQQCPTRAAVLDVLLREARAFEEFRNDGSSLTKCLDAITRGLDAVATSPVLRAGLSLASPPARPIFAAIGILLAAARDVNASYDTLVDLFGCVEPFLKQLERYVKIPLASEMTEILVKIMVELLSVFALATQQINQGRFRKYSRKLLRENDITEVLHRLDRLTDEEARMTVAQILEVLGGLIRNVTIVMEDGNASTEGISQALVTIQQTENEMARMNREQLQQDLRRWLSPPDPSTNQNIARAAHHDGTATWFTESDVFKQWKSTGSLLWIHGLPGCGKSVLCSTIIRHAQSMRAMGLAIVAYFYADFRDPAKQDIRGILSSLMIQLCTQADHFCEILSSLYSKHERGFQQPDNDALVQCLKDMLEDTKQAPVYLVIDALDECPDSHGYPSPRAQALKVVKELIDLKLPHLHFCVTSRPEVDIRMTLEPLELHSVSLHDEYGQNEDIRRYIKSVVLSDAKMRDWPDATKTLVIDTLASQCGGMFRWAYCQLEMLRRCPLWNIPRALDLHKNLDETYERVLQRIDQEKWEYTCRIFQFLTVSARPPRVEELAEIFAIQADEGTTGILKFDPRCRPQKPEEAVLTACSSLITVINVYGDKVVQFAHFSVREFLISDHLQRPHPLSQFYIDPRLAHTFLAKACLTILLQLNSRIHKNNIGRMFPLANYAAQHWVGHAQRGDVPSLIESGMELLFNRDKPYFAPWIWVYDMDNPSGPHMDHVNPGKPKATPLYYAALCGFLEIVERLIDTHPIDVDSRASDGGTPLHAALRNGHSDVALLLLENEADAKAQNSRKDTPLHLASRQGDINVMKTLMKCGADPNAKNGGDETPLSLASSNGMLNAAELLLDHGAGANNQGSQGRTALHAASENGHHEIVRLLVNKGAAIDARDRNDRTPLHLAVGEGRPIVARVLLDLGADVDACNPPSYWTPLHLASSGGRLDIVRLLLDHKPGADVNAQDEGGSTALHLAAYNGHEQVGKTLLKHGADRSLKNYEGKTPFELALESHHVEVKKLEQKQ